MEDLHVYQPKKAIGYSLKNENKYLQGNMFKYVSKPKSNTINLGSVCVILNVRIQLLTSPKRKSLILIKSNSKLHILMQWELT